MSHKDFILPPDLFAWLVMDIPMRIVQRKGQISEVFCCCCCFTQRALGNETPARNAPSVRQNAELYPQRCVGDTKGGRAGAWDSAERSLHLNLSSVSRIYSNLKQDCAENLKRGAGIKSIKRAHDSKISIC